MSKISNFLAYAYKMIWIDRPWRIKIQTLKATNIQIQELTDTILKLKFHKPQIREETESQKQKIQISKIQSKTHQQIPSRMTTQIKKFKKDQNRSIEI